MGYTDAARMRSSSSKALRQSPVLSQDLMAAVYEMTLAWIPTNSIRCSSSRAFWAVPQLLSSGEKLWTLGSNPAATAESNSRNATSFMPDSDTNWSIDVMRYDGHTTPWSVMTSKMRTANPENRQRMAPSSKRNHPVSDSSKSGQLDSTVSKLSFAWRGEIDRLFNMSNNFRTDWSFVWSYSSRGGGGEGGVDVADSAKDHGRRTRKGVVRPAPRRSRAKSHHTHATSRNIIHDEITHDDTMITFVGRLERIPYR